MFLSFWGWKAWRDPGPLENIYSSGKTTNVCHGQDRDCMTVVHGNIIIIDNHQAWASDPHIRVISEGSCDTEDWSNDAEHSGINYTLAYCIHWIVMYILLFTTVLDFINKYCSLNQFCSLNQLIQFINRTEWFVYCHRVTH